MKQGSSGPDELTEKLIKYQFSLAVAQQGVSKFPTYYSRLPMNVCKKLVYGVFATSATFAAVSTAFAAGNPNVDHQVQELLQYRR